MSRDALAWLLRSPFRQVRFMSSKDGVAVELIEGGKLVGRGRGRTPAAALRMAMASHPGWVAS